MLLIDGNPLEEITLLKGILIIGQQDKLEEVLSFMYCEYNSPKR